MATKSTQNLKPIVAVVNAQEAKSAKTGNNYRYLAVSLQNGYSFRVYLDDAQWFMVDALAEELEAGELNINED